MSGIFDSGIFDTGIFDHAVASANASATITQDSNSVSSAASVQVKAEASKTQEDNTSTAAAAVAVTGEGGSAQGGNSLTAAAAVAVTASAEITQANNAATGSSAASAVAAAAIIQAGNTVSAAATTEEIVAEEPDSGNVFKTYAPFRPELPAKGAWLDASERPDTLEAYAGAKQFPTVELPKRTRKKKLPTRKAKLVAMELRDGMQSVAQWNLDPVLIDNEMLLLLAA